MPSLQHRRCFQRRNGRICYLSPEKPFKREGRTRGLFESQALRLGALGANITRRRNLKKQQTVPSGPDVLRSKSGTLNGTQIFLCGFAFGNSWCNHYHFQGKKLRVKQSQCAANETSKKKIAPNCHTAVTLTGSRVDTTPRLSLGYL